MGDINEFIGAAWADHGDRPQEVAQRLEAGVGGVPGAASVGPYAALVVHVFGEHLARWEAGLRVLEALRAAAGDDRTTQALLDRQVATLRHARGDAGVAASLDAADRAYVLALCASIHAGRGDFAAAISDYRGALAAAGGGLGDGAPALRALAIGGNNLAAALEERHARSDDETVAMVQAAEGGLAYWRRAGTWLEHERAHYRLAMSLLAAVRPAEAAAAARGCLEVCDAHGADALECFFGHAVLARALRAAGDAAGFEASRRDALAAHAQLGDEQRRWCVDDLRALEDAA